MNILSILKFLFAIATAGTGLLALFKPDAVQSFTGLNVSNGRGRSEIRSIFGGLFIGLGLAPFWLGVPAFQTLGIGYLAIAAVRGFSILFEKSYEPSNTISLAVEIIMGIFLIL